MEALDAHGGDPRRLGRVATRVRGLVTGEGREKPVRGELVQVCRRTTAQLMAGEGVLVVHVPYRYPVLPGLDLDILQALVQHVCGIVEKLLAPDRHERAKRRWRGLEQARVANQNSPR